MFLRLELLAIVKAEMFGEVKRAPFIIVRTSRATVVIRPVVNPRMGQDKGLCLSQATVGGTYSGRLVGLADEILVTTNLPEGYRF
jgi:hypothetical protein